MTYTQLAIRLDNRQSARFRAMARSIVGVSNNVPVMRIDGTAAPTRWSFHTWWNSRSASLSLFPQGMEQSCLPLLDTTGNRWARLEAITLPHPAQNVLAGNSHNHT
jgi:hypothetical protein